MSNALVLRFPVGNCVGHCVGHWWATGGPLVGHCEFPERKRMQQIWLFKYKQNCCLRTYSFASLPRGRTYLAKALIDTTKLQCHNAYLERRAAFSEGWTKTNFELRTLSGKRTSPSDYQTGEGQKKWTVSNHFTEGQIEKKICKTKPLFPCVLLTSPNQC